MDKKNILVFPCGSEIGLEIYRSLKFSRFIELYGGSSVDDHGKFVFENYVGGFPFIKDNEFIPYLIKIIHYYNINAIFPTMDEVIAILKRNENKLSCKIISPPLNTVEICLSKLKTYRALQDLLPTPQIFSNINEIKIFPVFFKPEIGYGSRGVKKINNTNEAKKHLIDFPNSLMLEYLPGNEYTVDCFTDRYGELLFVGPRQRKRIRMGISVNTVPLKDTNCEFLKFAKKINSIIKFRGAWFFQVKRNRDNELVLMELAARLGGSSALYRGRGINFALLSVFDVFEIDVKVIDDGHDIEMDRAFDIVFKRNIEFDTIYVDLDDSLILKKMVNVPLLAFIFTMLNQGKKVILLTKHKNDLNSTLNHFRLRYIFDQIIHIDQNEDKHKYILSKKSIFIDDSFKERKEVKNKLNIPVLSPDMIENSIFGSI